MARSIHRSISQPEWAKSIVHLRSALALSQVGFGDVFHCSAMTVSRWERGISEPPSHTYIEMGNLGGDPRCWNFWERAGMSKGDLLCVVPERRERMRNLKRPALKTVTSGRGTK